VILQIEKPPENLMAGMTGEMNIIIGTHENVLLVPSRAVLVDQALVVSRGIVQKRTVKVGYHTLDVSEIMNGLSLRDRVVVSDQDRIHPGHMVRSRTVRFSPAIKHP
jgi:multidrug efflux pump subunit AcrA (membrane-fusion protein)